MDHEALCRRIEELVRKNAGGTDQFKESLGDTQHRRSTPAGVTSSVILMHLPKEEGSILLDPLQEDLKTLGSLAPPIFFVNKDSCHIEFIGEVGGNRYVLHLLWQ